MLTWVFNRLTTVFYNGFFSLDQYSFSQTTGWLINPLEEITDAFGALEIETVGVVGGVGGRQDQGLVALTSETCGVYPVVAGVGLFLYTFQVLVHFIGTTGHITLGEPSVIGTSVIFPIGTVLLFDYIPFQGHSTPGTMGLRHHFSQETICVKVHGFWRDWKISVSTLNSRVEVSQGCVVSFSLVVHSFSVVANNDYVSWLFSFGDVWVQSHSWGLRNHAGVWISKWWCQV